MHGGHDVRSRLVHRGVDDVSRRIDRVHVPTFLDLAAFTHQNQILGPHVAERLAVRVDTEVVRHDGVSYRDVAPGALVVVSLVPQPPERPGVVEFAKCSLSLQGFKFRDPDRVYRFGAGAADFLVCAVGEFRGW